MNVNKLNHAKSQAQLACDTLHRAVVDELPVGALVEYEVGERWIGPCRVVSHRPSNDCFGPQIVVQNLKTQKQRPISSFTHIRRTGAKQ